jgi:hypothetical protein
MTVAHRDVDPKNALTGAGQEVVLVDWDYAGPRLIAAELLDAALSFAGGPVDIDEACVLATVDAYGYADGPEISFADAAAPIIEEGFRWIMLNAWRCLGHRGVTAEQQDFAGTVVRTLAPSWPASVSGTREWAQRLAHHFH